MTDKKALFIQLAVLFLAIAGLERAVAWYAPRHYVPTQRMEAALAAGDGCLLILGDSRMVAAFDAAEFSKSQVGPMASTCVANLAIGALDIDGIGITALEYFRHGKKPRAILLGVVADSLLPPDPPKDPATFLGNRAIALAWSEANAVHRLFPGFPAGGIRVFDQGFRFLAARSNALGVYASLAWEKVQRAQDFLAGPKTDSRNSFGKIDEMARLEAELQKGAMERLRVAVQDTRSQRESAWFDEIEKWTGRTDAKLLLVELPMPASFRREVSDSQVALIYRAKLTERVARKQGQLLDLSHPAWLADTDFQDALHLTPEGGRKISGELGNWVAQQMGNPPADPPATHR